MSFLQRARDAATQAAEQARQAAERASDPEHRGALKSGISHAGEQARGAAHLARRGMKTVIERIDPATLAEVVIRATALQEMANRALAEKKSPYRISGIAISASVPPGVTFQIARPVDPGDAGRPSTELAGEATDAILTLDDADPGELEGAEADAADESDRASALQAGG